MVLALGRSHPIAALLPLLRSGTRTSEQAWDFSHFLSPAGCYQRAHPSTELETGRRWMKKDPWLRLGR